MICVWHYEGDPAEGAARLKITGEHANPGGAVQVKQQLVDAQQNNPQAQLGPEVAVDIIGEDYQRSGDIKNAIEIFQLDLLAGPEFADANDNLADAYLTAGQKDLARQYAEKALTLLDAHRVPASSWSDTDQKRGEVRHSEEQSSGCGDCRVS